MHSVLVLPSPLLPGSAYGALAAALVDGGAEVELAPSALGDDEGAHDLVRRWAALVSDDTVLVPHSNAGYLAPLVRAQVRGSQPIVFVDAALPPVTGSTRLAPPQFRAFLADLTDDEGRLPPWTRWWPRTVTDGVIPAELFDELDAACPRLSLGYFDATVEPPRDWAAGRNAYLAFGTTYADELELARGRGWPHASLAGAHLHFLHDPAAVAARVVDLAAALVQA